MSGMGNNGRIYKKLHKWPGLIIAFILLYYGITGIFMNHRELLSGIDIKRNLLPNDYVIKNWNNGALKGNLIINEDSILVYGNIGIWVTDSSFKNYRSLNRGFQEGIDNRKIFDLHKTKDGELFAATLFGLYAFDPVKKEWKSFDLNVDIKRFVGIETIDDTVYAINRSYLYKGKSKGIKTEFSRIELKAPDNYDNKISLFESMWQFHSGEIFGLPGKIFVDILGVTTIFLSVTGIIYFFFPNCIKNRKRKQKKSLTYSKINKWTLRWHNKIGAWVFILLILLYFTGMFLRPPLLIAIADAKLKPVKFTHLDQPNPWYDKLRDILLDKQKNKFLLSTSDGMFLFDRNNFKPEKFKNQPPVSVMGITSFKHFGNWSFLIGSFNGLFLWHPSDPVILNYAGGTVYKDAPSGKPIGEYKVTGTITDIDGNIFMVDYDKGVIPIRHDNTFPSMPENIVKESHMSLWNLSLEVHTGRFFKFLLSDFYILLVPLSGFTGIIVLLSGYLLWRKKYRNKQK